MEEQKKPKRRGQSKKQTQKKPGFRKVRNTVVLVAFILLAVYYCYLRIQEQQENQIPAQSITYQLAGENGEVRYDDNGNLIDTSNFLVSVKSSGEVLPKGFSFADFPSFRGQAVVTVNNNVPFFTAE